MYLTNSNIILNIKGKPQFVTIQRTPGPRTGNVRMPALDCCNVIKHNIYIQYPQLCILYFKTGKREIKLCKTYAAQQTINGPNRRYYEYPPCNKRGRK
jgi:hypothetical protein